MSLLRASSCRIAFVTSSRRGDFLALVLFLGLIIATAPWLRVYYRITAFELELTRAAANGERATVPIPAELDLAEFWNRTPEDLLPLIERRFQRFASKRPEAGASYELTVRYSFNSPRRDESVRFRAP